MERDHSKAIIRQSSTLHFIAETLVDHYIPDLRVEGAEFVKQAEEHLNNGEPVEIWFSPHSSHADFPVVHKGLTVAGSQKFAHDTYIVMGSMIKRHWATSKLIYAYNGVMVPSIRDIPTSNEGWDKRQDMKDTAFEVVVDLHSSNKALALNPEGTRKGGDVLKKGVPGVGRYLRLMKNGYILTAVSDGTPNVLKEGGWWPQKGPVEVRFGELISVCDLLERVESLSVREGDQKMVDSIMRGLAKLLPRDRQGQYGDSII